VDTETGAKPETEQKVVSQEQSIETTPPVQEKTYTQKELDDILAKAKETEEARVKGLNKVVSKKDSEIEALRKSATSDEKTLPILRKMAQALEKTPDTGYGSDEATKAAKSELKVINSEIAAMQANTERAKTEALRDTMWSKIKELGLDPDPNSENYDERLDPIVTFWTTGNFQIAQQRLDKLAAKIEKEKEKVAEKEPVKEEKVDSTKLEAEIRAKIIKEYGLDKQDVDNKSGATSRSFKNAEAAYVKGEISYSEYTKARKEAGIN
jgi:hypothetical protein